jgi:hypothetical protein
MPKPVLTPIIDLPPTFTIPIDWYDDGAETGAATAL